MSFGRWIDQAPYLVQCGAIARNPYAARLVSLPPRLQHAAVELLRGTMVSHSFIAYRDDRPDESQPITFAGSGWRGYVPIELPWTVCVRERLPPAASRFSSTERTPLPILYSQLMRSRISCSEPSTASGPCRRLSNPQRSAASTSAEL